MVSEISKFQILRETSVALLATEKQTQGQQHQAEAQQSCYLSRAGIFLILFIILNSPTSISCSILFFLVRLNWLWITLRYELWGRVYLERNDVIPKIGIRNIKAPSSQIILHISTLLLLHRVRSACLVLDLFFHSFQWFAGGVLGAQGQRKAREQADVDPGWEPQKADPTPQTRSSSTLE